MGFQYNPGTYRIQIHIPHHAENHFQLAYMAIVHNYHQKFFVHLNSPIENIAALVLMEADFDGDPAENTVYYLDADFNQLSHETITEYRIERK